VPILMVCAFVTLIGMISLEEYFYRTRPRLPDPTTQRLYAQNVKSSQGVAEVYLTHTEKLPFEWMQYWNPILVTAIIVTASALVIQKPRRSAESSR
jgi:hypothetical protein